MAGITLSNYRSELLPELIKSASALPVRECDVDNGVYVAYIDEGDDSRDVSLTVNKQGAVVAFSCDCETGGKHFCRHCAALLLHVAQNRQTVTGKLKPAKKATAAEKKQAAWMKLLEDTPGEALRTWLRDYLPGHKEAELAFIHYFTAKTKTYTAAEISSMTDDAVKATLGKRRKLEKRDLTAIVRQWADLHRPIVEQYGAAVADAAGFTAFHAVVDACLDFCSHYAVGSGDVATYPERLLQSLEPNFLSLKTQDAWDAATGYFLPLLFDETRMLWRMPYLLHLRNLLLQERGSTRGQALMERLADAYRPLMEKRLYNQNAPNTIMFSLLQQLDLFARYRDLVVPVRWDSKLNGAMVRELMKLHEWKEAVKICKDQIAANVRDEFDVVYLQLLKEIYTITNAQKLLAEVMASLLPLDFDYEAYLFVLSRTPDEDDRKALRNTLYTKARRGWRNGSPAAVRFCMEVLLSEGSGMKLMSMLDEKVSYTLLVAFAGRLIAVDKMRFLRELILRYDTEPWSSGLKEDRQALVAELYSILQAHIDKSAMIRELNAALASVKYYVRPNDFAKYLRQQLTSIG